MSDPVLVLAWLVLAHLVADFVLQDDATAGSKGSDGRAGRRALLMHGGHVALCLVPAVLAFGLRGLAFLVVVVATHVVVDRWKVRATRAAEAGASRGVRAGAPPSAAAPQPPTAERPIAGAPPTDPDAASGLGRAWTPIPALLFVADQAIHVAVTLVAWLVLLEGVPLLGPWVDITNAALRGWDRGIVHGTTLTAVVLVSLLLVNTRAAYFFVLSLVTPRELAPAGGSPASNAAQPARAYTVRVGPLLALVEPTAAPTPDATPSPASLSPAPPVPVEVAVPGGAPARIGATIGALERLLVVAFILGGAATAVGFVIAAKTIARFKQLDDRGFAEYYLLGTLASMSVAIGSALLAQAALATLP